MPSLDDFLNNNKNKELENMEEIDGIYGCQSCELYTNKAYFDHKTFKMIWICPRDHESFQQIG